MASSAEQRRVLRLGMGPALDFLRLLWALDHALHGRSKRMARELGATGPQRLVLRLLGRHPGLAAGELAALMHVHPSTLTKILQRLEARRLIRRRSASADKRRVELSLTPQGIRLSRDNAHSIEAVVRRQLQRTAAADLEATRRTLEQLTLLLAGPFGEDDRA